LGNLKTTPEISAHCFAFYLCVSSVSEWAVFADGVQGSLRDFRFAGNIPN